MDTTAPGYGAPSSYMYPAHASQSLPLFRVAAACGPLHQRRGSGSGGVTKRDRTGTSHIKTNLLLVTSVAAAPRSTNCPRSLSRLHCQGIIFPLIMRGSSSLGLERIPMNDNGMFFGLDVGRKSFFLDQILLPLRPPRRPPRRPPLLRC